MTEAERDEFIDLYVDDALPEALWASVESYLAAHPGAATEVAALRLTLQKLKTAPHDRPDGWFAERTLDRLLDEHAAAQETESTFFRRH